MGDYLKGVFTGVAAVAVLVIGLAWWQISGHEERTIQRVVDAGIVRSAFGVKLLHSTGLLHDNTHIFECQPESLIAGTNEGIPLTNVRLRSESENIAQELQRAREWIEPHSQKPIDWKAAQVFEGEGRGILSYVYVVKTSDKRVLVALKVF